MSFHKIYFQKRIPEPKEMGKVELDVFEKISKESYKRWIIPLVDDILEKSKLKNGRILDVGCGPGLLVKELASRSNNLKVFGIDISSHAIRQAKTNCKDIKNVFIKVSNAYKLPFPNNYFDLVVCKDNLHQFPKNPIRILKEMTRVVKSDGLVYISDLRRDVPLYLLKKVIPPDNMFKKLLYYSARAAYIKLETKQFMKQAGLVCVKIKTRQVTSEIKKKYSRLGIWVKELRESFQRRYVVIGKKHK